LRISDFYRGGYTSVLDRYNAEADTAGSELNSFPLNFFPFGSVFLLSFTLTFSHLVHFPQLTLVFSLSSSSAVVSSLRCTRTSSKSLADEKHREEEVGIKQNQREVIQGLFYNLSIYTLDVHFSLPSSTFHCWESNNLYDPGDETYKLVLPSRNAFYFLNQSMAVRPQIFSRQSYFEANNYVNIYYRSSGHLRWQRTPNFTSEPLILIS
jgi:hypothetical protein